MNLGRQCVDFRTDVKFHMITSLFASQRAFTQLLVGNPGDQNLLAVIVGFRQHLTQHNRVAARRSGRDVIAGIG